VSRLHRPTDAKPATTALVVTATALVSATTAGLPTDAVLAVGVGTLLVAALALGDWR
jgi:hypothetical protein